MPSRSMFCFIRRMVVVFYVLGVGRGGAERDVAGYGGVDVLARLWVSAL